MESQKTFKAVKTDFKDISVEEVDCPPVNEGQVLVKVEAAPINPSDELCILGKFGSSGDSHSSSGVGFEGSGTIVDAHEGMKDMIGKKVAFTQAMQSPNYQGTWRQYIVLEQGDFMVIEGDISLEKASAAFINPITVLAIVGVAKAGGHTSIIHSAACSSLGKMLVKYCKHENITLINIVRRKEQVKILEDLGAENVLDSSEKEFQDLLKNLVTNLNTTAFFDAVGGELLGTVLEWMPQSSHVHVYGSMASEDFTYSAANLLMWQKTITHLIGGAWLKSQSKEIQKQVMGIINDDLNSGGEIFGISVAHKYPLDDVQKALDSYKSCASEGKIIIVPNVS